MTLRQRRSPSHTLPPSFTGNTSSKGKYTGGTIEENQVHSYNMRKNSHWRSSHEKNLMLCALLLSVLLSGCAAEPLQGQTAGNTSKAPTPQKETPAFFEPVSTDSSVPAKAPTEAVDPADSMPNEDKHESGPAISSEPVNAHTESNAPSSEETEQPPVLPEKPEETESPAEEPSAPATTEPEPAPEPVPWH